MCRVYWPEYMSIASTVATTRSLDLCQLVSAFVLIPKLHKLVFTFVNAIYDYLICVYDVFIIVFSPQIKKYTRTVTLISLLGLVQYYHCGFLWNHRAQQSSSNIEQIPAIRNCRHPLKWHAIEYRKQRPELFMEFPKTVLSPPTSAGFELFFAD